MNAVVTRGLTKLYSNRVGCRDIDLEVPAGCVFGFLGPNGAGKSTLVKVLVGLLHPTAGEARLLGRPLGEIAVRRRIGYLPENFRYQDWLTGTELLHFHAALCGLPARERRRRIGETLELVGLTGREHHRVRTYSKGMQQRLGVACALIGDPDLVFLDEPTSALDPLGRREMREVIVRLRERGKTVFLNSHLLGEVEAVCDTVAIINQGQIVARGRLDDLLAPTVQVEMDIEGLTPGLEEALAAQATGCHRNGSRLTLTLARRADVPRLAETVVAAGGRLHSLIPRQRSLEDLFVQVIRGEGQPGDPHTAPPGVPPTCS
ncbi:MAG: ABC transporter ATP-binding protein [Bacillota bacterium]|nr:ABC transporter ATP-binding protein [Bacillota bacterium]